MKHHLSAVVIICLIAATAAAAQPRNYPPNELPMFGGVQKNAAMLEADRKFIETTASMGMTRPQGAQESVRLGWLYFSKGDFATAMKRFNQAWLLDPDNPAVYHGFAVTLVQRDGKRFESDAEALFRRSISYANAPPVSYADYGRFLNISNRFGDAIPVIERGIARHQEKPDGALPDLIALYAIALYQAGRRTEACAAARTGLERGHDELYDTLVRILATPDCKT